MNDAPAVIVLTPADLLAEMNDLTEMRDRSAGLEREQISRELERLAVLLTQARALGSITRLL